MNCKLYLKPWNPTRRRLCLPLARYVPQPRQHTEARTILGFAWTDSFRETVVFNGLGAVCCRLTALHSSSFRYISNVTTSCPILNAMKVDDDSWPTNHLQEAWSARPSGIWSILRIDLAKMSLWNIIIAFHSTVCVSHFTFSDGGPKRKKKRKTISSYHALDFMISMIKSTVQCSTVPNPFFFSF